MLRMADCTTSLRALAANATAVNDFVRLCVSHTHTHTLAHTNTHMHTTHSLSAQVL